MMDRQLRAQRRRVEQLPRRGRGVRYPTRLRAEIAAWAAQRIAVGARWREISLEVGAPVKTLRRWVTARAQDAIAVRPVEVIDALNGKVHQ